MADKVKLKKLLQEGASIGRRSINEQQLEEAASTLIRKTSVTRDELKLVGKDVANDPELFAATDIDDINDILGGLKK